MAAVRGPSILIPPPPRYTLRVFPPLSMASTYPPFQLMDWGLSLSPLAKAERRRKTYCVTGSLDAVGFSL